MILEQLIFYVFSATLLVSAVMVVISQNPVRSALFLVLAFFASGGLWILLEAEFLALILVLVYVGAVMTLFLFVVMTLNLDAHPDRKAFLHYLPLGVLIVAGLGALVIHILGQRYFDATQFTSAAHNPANYSNTQALGALLYTHYAFPFEIAGVLLLVAIIAAVCLTARTVRRRKQQTIEKQLAVKREERVRLVKMTSEKGASL